MTKVFKKLLPLLLATLMVFGMATTALAAGNGQITVNNTVVGKEYELYRIFDLTQSTSGNAVSYTIAPAWEDFFFNSDGTKTAAGTTYLLDAQPTGGSLNAITYNGNTYYINITDSNVADFANAAQVYAGTTNADASATATGTSLVFSNLDLGYYLVFPVDATEIATGNSSICSLTNAAPNGVINSKGEYPDIDKTVNDQDVEVGQTVTYTITGKVPDTTGYDTFTYEVHDTMSAGLTFGTTAATTNFTVKFGNTIIYDKNSASLPTGMTLSFANNGFVVNFDMVQFQSYKGQTITISYDSIVNDDAVCQLTENEAYLKYGHDPEDLEETTHKEIEVYSSRIVIDKYETGSPSTKLQNAEFVLYKNVTEEYEEAGEPLTRTVKYYYRYIAATATDPARVEWVAEGTNGEIPATATRVLTDVNGAATFAGLESGDYYLHETASPAGYNLLPNDVLVEVRAPQTDVNGKEIGVSVTKEIANSSGTQLPQTGGIGTTIFYIAGAVLLIGAGVLLFVRKRVKYEK